MDTDALKKLIELGESETLEFKKSLAEQAEALKTAAAFANGHGGWILFGVKLDGSIIGVDIGVNTLENLAEAFHQHTDPIILAAVREAIANAVAHRDYSANEPIQIRLFDDRLEIQSPGPLPSELTIERILTGGVTRARNPILAQILLADGYMERAGFGIVFIHQQTQRLGAPAPDFESGLAHFLVRLWARPNPNLVSASNQQKTNSNQP